MTIRVAINGYGRIGRNIVRALYETNRRDDIQVVWINDLGDVETNAHLTRYDTTHGRFQGEVAIDNGQLIVNGDAIRMTSERNPSALRLSELNVDLVLECTGIFKSKEKAQAFLDGGAQKVLISAPGAKDVDATVVYGVNHQTLRPEHRIVSNASCTTNCLAPLAKALNETVGIESGLMTTIHAYTNDQVLSDTQHSDLRRARSATSSMIPTKTGAASAVALVMPELAGRLDGFAIRIPTINVSLVDLTFQAGRDTSVEEIDGIVRDYAEGELAGILAYSDGPLVSVDFNHHPASSIYDATLTRVTQGSLVKACSWYDNEWGFSCRMLDTAVAMMT